MVEESRVTPIPRKAFSKEEKAALVLLMIAGVGGLFFGFRYLGKNLNSPFSFSYSGPQYLTANEQETMQIEELKSRDTDSDGLNDYDEHYVYKTSAYLSDSDSDGVNDGSEVSAGGDPNCPTGKTCSSALVDVAPDASDVILDSLTEPVEPDLTAAEEVFNAAQNGTVDEETVINSMTPEQLRELLVSNGAAQAEVDALTDTQLMELYAQVLSQYQTTSTP